MREFHIMVGVPGSGKSTVAVRLVQPVGEIPIVETDLIREDLIAARGCPNGDPYFDPECEDDVWALAYKFVGQYLRPERGRVILDATNLTRAERRVAKAVARSHDAAMFAHVIRSVPFEECLRRNKIRGRRVPLGVMGRMLMSYEREARTPTLVAEGWVVREW